MKAPTFRTRSLICLALAAGAFMLASPALAKPARIAVLPFQGPSAERLRGAVVNKLSSSYEVVSLTEIRRAAASVTRPMGPAALWQVVSRRLDLSAVIKGQVTAGRRWQARLIVNQASSGVSVGSVVISEPRSADLIREVARTAPARLVSLVRRTHGGGATARGSAARRPVAALADDRAPDAGDRSGTARAAEPLARREGMAGDDEDAVESLVASGSRAATSRPPMLEASVGPRAIFRALTFADNYSAVPGYRLPGAAGIAAEVAFYPAAQMNVDSWLQNLGLHGMIRDLAGRHHRRPRRKRHGHRPPGLHRGRAQPAAAADRHRDARGGLRRAALLAADPRQRALARGPLRLRAPQRRRTAGPGPHLLRSFGRLPAHPRRSRHQRAQRVPQRQHPRRRCGRELGYAFDRDMQVQLGADYRRYA